MATEVLTFDEAFRVGLRPDDRAPRGAQVLEYCSGLRTTPMGLRDFYPIDQKMTDSYITALYTAKSWPFPQLLRCKAMTLLAFEDVLFEVTETVGGYWTAAQVTTYDIEDPRSTKSITGDGPWHVMDFYDTVMLFNGSCQVFKTGLSTKWFVQDTVTIKTGCDFKEGRGFYGGFDPSDFLSSDWQTIIEGFYSDSPKGLRPDLTLGADQNWVWWSTIGGGDLFWLFRPDLMVTQSPEVVTNGAFTTDDGSWTLAGNVSITGGKLACTASGINSATQLVANQQFPIVAGRTYIVKFTVSSRTAGSVQAFMGAATGAAADSNTSYEQEITQSGASLSLGFVYSATFDGSIDNLSIREKRGYSTSVTFLQDLWKRNEAGIRPMPWQGSVLQTRPMGDDAVIVYGEDGATALVPFSSPIATMGARDIVGLGDGIGPASRSAVGGGRDGHLFVDKGGDVWLVKPDLSAQWLGYQEFLKDVADNDVVVSYDAHHKEFHIADGSACYVWNGGFCRAKWMPTSISFAQGSLVGVTIQDFTLGYYGVAYVVTHPFTGSDGGMWEVFKVKLIGVDTDETVSIPFSGTPAGWVVSVNSRSKLTDDWTEHSRSQSGTSLLDGRGEVTVSAIGSEFQVIAQAITATYVRLDRLQVYMRRLTDGKVELAEPDWS